MAYKSESLGDVPGGLAADVGTEYEQFLRHISTLAGSWNAPVEVPEDPLTLSFEAASTLTSSVELPQGIRQEILEVETGGERLVRLLPLLQRANELIQEQLSKNNPFRGPRLN